ncbi:glycosyltransferase [Moorena sp. SIO4G3]|uniref:glycosyltransferase n=1 Tax=Moorena sp. SIO4G3 TaxID=2607821 RepID=UPI00142ABE83|nr:glycosyltransferase [Moorena sp. SIO4G3]NEO81607.1 glycosyltransferase [Moorena sp. SIO4G3]
MRFVFLLPDFSTSTTWQRIYRVLSRPKLKPIQSWVRRRWLYKSEVNGGDLNIMRHCLAARESGADAVIATMTGRNTFGNTWGIHNLPFIRWADRRPDDVCIIPDWLTLLINDVKGPAIAYLQVPILVKADFEYRDSRVALWTDSPFMKEVCEAAYPGKDIEIVPNVVDNEAFPFIPQAEREAGLVFAFPRKGPEFITQTEEWYQKLGGTYWRFERVDGLPFQELAKQFRRPQVFLASAEVEGCALPPQESMAAGIVVVGKTARGANFCMEHRKTAMAAETPEAAARSLLELEHAELRDNISRNAHNYISRYFSSQEPARFWQKTVREYSSGAQQVVSTSR